MPSKKRKYNARFPAGRIKKIMRLDNDIGKVALPVPVMISRALELFVSNLLEKAGNITMQKNARTLTLTHLKQCIYSDSRLDFLKELVKNIPDISEECNDINVSEKSVRKKKSITNSDSNEEELTFSKQRFIGVENHVEKDSDAKLQLIHSQILDGCACRLSVDEYDRLVSSPANVSSTWDTIARFSTARLLLSTRHRRQCPTVERACSALVSDPTWLNYLLDAGLSSSNEYVRHAAACAVSEAAFCCAASDQSRFNCLIDKLVVSILSTGHGTAAAINVLARVLNAEDDGRRATRMSCAAMSETSESPAAAPKNREIKTLLLDRLHDCWPDVVYAVVGERRPSVDGGTIALSELVRLWKSIVSASSTGSRYYSGYYSKLTDLRDLLYRTDTDPYVWLNTIRLFGASLNGCCSTGYGTAIAMAETIVTGVTRRRLLFYMDKMKNSLGRDDSGTIRVVQETVLLTMRSLRVLAVRGDADHRSSVVDAARMVVDCLDSYVKSSAIVAADVRFCRWMVRLLYDRDDAIVECLTCALDIVDAAPAVRPEFDPFESFAEFLECLRFEPDVLLDYLISDENDFLPYALKILKTALCDVGHFFRACGDKLENTMHLLIKLRLKMLRLHENNVFPYNIIPIARLIQQCDELYSEIAL